MIELLKEETLKEVASFNGIKIYHLMTTKFKTNSINVFFHDQLSKKNATKNALIPAVLRRGCQKYKSFQEIALYLEELYGATFDCGVNKKGETQICHFYIDFVADKYAGEGGLFDKAFQLLHEIITEPILEEGIFKKEFVQQEKDNLKSLIEGRINDKVQYAVDRCFEEMCSNEPYGIHEYGSVEDLKNIDEKELFAHYINFIKSLPISIYITGPVEENSIQNIINTFKKLPRDKVKEIPSPAITNEIQKVKEVTDEMSINQGKLSIGFRTNISPADPEYYHLFVYNGILGGGIHSKLFQNVREKASLAYYAFSRLEKFKGLMIISSGIQIENKQKAYDIIIEQMEDIGLGNISDNEFEATLKTIETGIKSFLDSQLQMVDFYLGQALTNTNETLFSIIDKVKKVTKEDVINVSKRIELDTIYFLTSNQQEGAEAK